MTPRPHVLDDCWCGQNHHDEIRGDGDDLRVRQPDSRAGSQAGSNGPSGSLNPSPRRAPGRMEQDEFNSRLDAGEDPYSIVADDRARSAATSSRPWVSAANAALWMLNEAVAEHDPSHVFGMFSGGHDSLTATAIAAKHPRFTAAVHINTGVGIAETREFVRATCERQGWPLIELHPDGKSYRDLVVEKGMPGGPKAHNTQFYWLKQRAIRRLVREHKQHRHGRIALVTGIRASESERRMAAALAVPVRRNGAQLWLNPILDWTAIDCSQFMEAQGLQRNRVVDLLHRSGECLCGALAKASEISEIEAWFPKAAAELHEYERLAREAGHNDDVWAGRARRVAKAQPKLPLCWSCEAGA